MRPSRLLSYLPFFLLGFCILCRTIERLNDDPEQNIEKATILPTQTEDLNFCPKVTQNSTKPTNVELYIMSKCPYGSDAIINFAPVLDKLGPYVNFSVYYVAKYLGNDQFESLHGQTEVLGDIWQLCAIYRYSLDYKYMDFLTCLSRDYMRIPTNADDCAEDAGIEYNILKDCVEGELGKNLLRQSIKNTENRGVTASPTIFINDVRYRGARDSDTLVGAICADDDNLTDDRIWILVGIGAGCLVFLGVVVIFIGLSMYHYCNNASEQWVALVTSSSVNDSLAFGGKIKESLEAFADCESEGGSLLVSGQFPNDPGVFDLDDEEIED
eukprot:TRINITY_DN6497_c0_g1_i1.p1 TRINITY_DN6497_c0_g1~~TRINITY_DN6497_c0_g1_i1.p1  ORF type:complete len:327 (+),score=39.39 TRINITY_DN6497_c0_g1_i1:65-1045(+)